jgi:hypothetical protein
MGNRARSNIGEVLRPVCFTVLGDSQHDDEDDNERDRDDDGAHDPDDGEAGPLGCALVENALARMVAVTLAGTVVGLHVGSSCSNQLDS